MDIVIYFGVAVHFSLTATLVRERYSKAAPVVDCERLRKVDYSSYEFTVDLGKPKR